MLLMKLHFEKEAQLENHYCKLLYFVYAVAWTS